MDFRRPQRGIPKDMIFVFLKINTKFTAASYIVDQVVKKKKSPRDKFNIE